MQTKTRKQIKDEFLKKWNEIEADIPDDFLAKAIELLPKGTNINRITNVRYGRTYDIEILEALDSLIDKPSKNDGKKSTPGT